MSDEKTSSPAPAVIPNAPAAESPPIPTGVDLSDLQAEQDAANAKAAEEDVYNDINKSEEKPEPSEEELEEEAFKDEKSEEDKDEEGKDTEQPKKRTRADRYRDQISRLEQENATLRSRTGGSPTKADIAERVGNIIGPEPQEKDFDNYLEYDREKTAWTLERRQATRQVEAAIKAGEQERSQRMTDNLEAHRERVELFRTRNGEESAKDFDAVMAKAKDLPVSPVVEELILDSGKSAHLQYFFARNPERLDKINHMSERNAAREIGQIEARLSLPPPRTKTAAPPPARTPRGGAAPASQEAELNSWLSKKYGGSA
jgi:hypothetical protein